MSGTTTHPITYSEFATKVQPLDWNAAWAYLRNTTRVTTTYTVLVTDHIIFADTDGGAFTVTLPAGVEGQHLRITNCGSAGLDLTIDGSGSETVMGELTQDMGDGETMNLYYNATEGWW